MKKLYRSLLTIAISAPLLSGCSLLGETEFPVETKKIEGLSLRDYTKVVLQNQNYEYDGKVYVLYGDETEKEVTSYCTFESVDTSTLGEKSFKVRYETTSKIYSKIGKVTVVDSVSLEGIEVSDYTNKVKMDEAYTFDGKVTATYASGLTKDVTSDAVISDLDTSSCGSKTLHISYTEGSVTKTAEASVEVQPYLVEIVVSGYKSSYTLNDELDEKITVEAKYSDGTKKDVTSQAAIDFSDIKTDILGTYHISVSYTEDGKTSEASIEVLVLEKQPELQSIEARDYSLTVEKGSIYKFDGTVWATFDQGEPVNVTSDCDVGSISTSSVGDKTLTISYKDPNWNITKTCKVTITVVVSVTNITGDSSVKVGIGDSVKINASVYPTNATNKSLSYASQDESVATVDSNGNVTGVKKGETTVIVSSVDKPSVTASVAVYVLDDPKVTGIVASSYTTSVNKGDSYTFDGTVTASYSSGSPKVVTENLSYSGIDTSTGGNKTLTITYTDPVWGNSVSCQITITVISHVTGISVNSSFTVGLNSTTNLNASVLPTDANNKSLTYSSANTSIATVAANGDVTGKASGTTTITITSVDTPSVKEDVTVTVSEKDAWTILLYLCGADLESGGDYGTDYGGAATEDLQEILSVSGQPSDVNFVVQTGGASAWQSDYGISASNNQRWHVANKSLVKDNNKVYTSYKGMGEASTLKDFLVWGLETYPANKVGLILWNHGGGLDGVCYDEKKNNNSLTNDEVVTAVSGALTETGLSKLEFIGYDACLMQMMEIAEFNAPYFNYQIASQESEAGTGWDYDTWVDDLYAKKSTENILKAIVDGFITDNGGVNGTGYNYQGQYYPADQTLSYLDLNQIADFKSAWEAMATQVKSKITTSNKSTFKNNVVGASKYFAGDDYTYYAEFDCYDFLDKLSSNSTFNPGGNYISNARTALTNLVKYNVVQKEGAANAYGLSFYFGEYYNSSTYSHFSNWISLCSTVGGF